VGVNIGEVVVRTIKPGDAAPGSRQLNNSSPVFRRIRWMCSRHWLTPSFLTNTVHQTGSTPGDPSVLSDKMAGHLRIALEEKQALLECANPVERLQKILGYLSA